MKISISVKLTAILCLFGLLLTGLASYYSLSNSKQILLEAAKRDLLLANQVLGRNLQLKLQGAATDTRLLAKQPQPLNILLDAKDKASESMTLARMFEALMEASTAYQGIRLIGAQQHGLELLSVTRNGLQPDSALKEKGHYAYVFKTLKMARDGQFISGIESDKANPDAVLMLQLASPVWSAQQAAGVIVISLDITEVLARLKNQLPEYYQVFLANDKGQLLLDPDHLATDSPAGAPDVLLQEQIPALGPLINGQASNLLAVLPDKYNQPSRLATFTRLLIGQGDSQTPLILGLAVPEEHILRASNELDQRMIRILLGLSLLSLLLSLWLAKTLLRPLNQTTRAISQFTHDLSLLPLPTKRRDELGKLARQLQKMQEKILAQLNELRANHIQMQRMAHDDALTGLPNRRLFFDRLEHALSKARRSGKQVGLLYVDLDAFKEINDTYGHTVGDEALRIVARLLNSVTRESDTVARLGGDEFVLLLEELDDPGVMLDMAKKLRAYLQNRLFIKGHELHLTASLGISIFPLHAADADTLVQSADNAMTVPSAGAATG